MLLPLCAALIDLLSEAVAFEDLRGLAFFGTIMTGAAHGLKPLGMQPAFLITLFLYQ